MALNKPHSLTHSSGADIARLEFRVSVLTSSRNYTHELLRDSGSVSGVQNYFMKAH